MAGIVVEVRFTVNTSLKVKSVHVRGSWNSYKNEYPLIMRNYHGEIGYWELYLRFQGGNALQPGCKYCYYYISKCDESGKEFDIGRMLNFEIPAPKGSQDT